MVHERDPVAQRVGLLHVVGGEQHRHAELVLHPRHLRPDTVARNRIQADGGFVEDQQRRPVHQRLGQFEPAHHAAGVRAGQVVGDVEQLHRVQRLVDAGAALLARARRTAGRTGRRSACPSAPTRSRVVVAHSRCSGGCPRCRAGSRSPKIRTSPSCTGVSVVSTRTTVVLPAPLGPSRPTVSPALHLEVQVVDRGEVAVAVGQVAAVDGRRAVTASSSRQQSGHVGQHRQAVGQVGRSGRRRGVRAPRSRAARRAARDSSAMRCADSVSRSRPTRRSSGSTVRTSRPSADNRTPASRRCSGRARVRSRPRAPRCRAACRRVAAVRPVIRAARCRSTGPPPDRRTWRRNRPTVPNSSPARSVRMSTAPQYLCCRANYTVAIDSGRRRTYTAQCATRPPPAARGSTGPRRDRRARGFRLAVSHHGVVDGVDHRLPGRPEFLAAA